MGTEPATMEFQETDTLWENQVLDHLPFQETICSRYREYVNNKSGGVANKWVCPKLVNTPTTMETYEIKKTVRGKSGDDKNTTEIGSKLDMANQTARI